MDPINVAGWSITGLLAAGGLLRAMTVWLNDRTRSGRLPKRRTTFVPQLGRHLLVSMAVAAALLSVLGSSLLPFKGLWGPLVLVFSVIWDINAGWKVHYLPWYAPIELGLRDGSRIVLLGGALGTLIAYVLTAAPS